MPNDHDGTQTPLTIYGVSVTACDFKHSLGFRITNLTGLIGFTLSHYGSHTPLPTLKSGLAASTPRLSTDCWLDFVGRGLAPL